MIIWRLIPRLLHSIFFVYLTKTLYYIFILLVMHLWTHKKLEIGYNGKSIVDVNLTSDGKVELKKDAKIHFTFEVVWKESNVPFVDRFDKYLDPNFFQHRVSLKFVYLSIEN